MSRHPTKGTHKSPYITQQGFESLQEESQDLWKKRREVVIHLRAAAAEGDRSENAEYIYRKKQLRELDRRIRYLQKRLPELQVVAEKPHSLDRVFFGAWIRLEDESGNEVSYRIVGADEFDPKNNWISVDSPMARALMGKELEHEVQVRTPQGTREYTLLSISYEEDNL